LQAAGHKVFTLTLTGIGERSHLLSRDINLETHILDVVNLIRWEELSDVILCGHSYAGAVVSGAADQLAGRIRALVYLDAFLLDSGESLHATLPAAQREHQLHLAAEVGEGWKVPPIPAAVFQVNPADADWVNRQCTMHPLAAFQQPLHLSGRLKEIGDVTYIHATGWAQASPFGPHAARAHHRGYRMAEMGCGHDVMLDEPEALAKLLLGVAIGSSH
jgi:pimeloyl-ACP methyl ester carboxylesterase